MTVSRPRSAGFCAGLHLRAQAAQTVRTLDEVNEPDMGCQLSPARVDHVASWEVASIEARDSFKIRTFSGT